VDIASFFFRKKGGVFQSPWCRSLFNHQKIKVFNKIPLSSCRGKICLFFLLDILLIILIGYVFRCGSTGKAKGKWLLT
jgi:hypothetical protein